MIQISALLFTLFWFWGCSFESPPNQWQYNSANTFDSYTKNFLQGKEDLATNDLRRAQEHARMSADLRTLAQIYLGKCALNIAVGRRDGCEQYLQIAPALQENSLQSYYALLQKNIAQERIQALPKRYKEFAQALQIQNYNKAFEAILSMDQISSQLVAAALIREDLTTQQIEKMIEKSSFYGYKKAVLFWLEQLKAADTDPQRLVEIERKIHILTKGIE